MHILYTVYMYTEKKNTWNTLYIRALYMYILKPDFLSCFHRKNMAAFIGVDVGTGSARAALVNEHGQVLHTHVTPILIHNPRPEFYEQSSKDIWSAVCSSVRKVNQDDGGKHHVKGIGFDATCSLVLHGASLDDDKCWDIIMWMDHRADKEAEIINATKHHVLEYVGGSVSLEMETPKLLWLKKNLPKVWSKTEDFFDLADYLSFKASGSKMRSLCTVVCKWTYRGQDDEHGKAGWDESFFKQIGLADLAQDNFGRIGTTIAT
jgi:FGGY-family pentulose kinase